ncbi:MAG: FAD binding domain-containing protein [Proteobacteria bacterium]|nr:FAD binding domain-containing protein [Pseudomonadota bacterium]
MKPAAFDYVRAGSVAEAAALLAEGAPDARLLAGGQSLGPMLNLRLARPARLIDLKRAAGLRDVMADETTLRIGAGWTHAEIEDGAVEDPARGMLRHVARGIAYRAVRNRGTLGGSLAHADPAADWVAVMAALGAAIVAQRAGGAERRIAAEGFVRGAFATALAPGEVLAAVEIPRLSPKARWGYHKVCRKTGEFAKAIGVAMLDPARGMSRVLAGAVEAAPVLLPHTAARLAEAGPDAAAAIVAEETGAALPHLSPAERALRAVAVRRALAQLDGG